MGIEFIVPIYTVVRQQTALSRAPPLRSFYTKYCLERAAKVRGKCAQNKIRRKVWPQMYAQV
jgi:hypothetical protein